MSLPAKILIVDDDPALRMIAQHALKNAGYDTRTAWDGETALEEVRAYLPDLVLLDVNMPGMDGFEVCQHIKTDPQLKSIFVMIISALVVDTDSKVQGLSIGADGYIERPVANRELVARVQSLLRIRSAELALQTSVEQWQSTFDAVQDAIFLTGPDTTILRCNQAAARFFNLAEERIVGRKCREIVRDEQVPSALCPFLEVSDKKQREILQIQANGRWIEASVDPVTDASGAFAGSVHVLADVTERKLAEEKINIALAEKDTLLRELYHRTKNNMQVISAMLSLQKDYSDDPAVAAILTEMDNRIQSMSMVHQKLLQSRNLSSIDLGDYLRELSALLEDSYKSSPRVTITLDLESINVLIDLAIPCGLILNELVSNALKYAFAPGERGEIKVTLKMEPNQVIFLSVSDTGAGLPEGFLPRQDGKLGMQTLFALVEQQLRGEIEFINENGLAINMRFKETLVHG